MVTAAMWHCFETSENGPDPPDLSVVGGPLEGAARFHFWRVICPIPE